MQRTAIQAVDIRVAPQGALALLVLAVLLLPSLVVLIERGGPPG